MGEGGERDKEGNPGEKGTGYVQEVGKEGIGCGFPNVA